MANNPIEKTLIIDNDAPLASGLQKLLVRSGFVVHTAGNGRLGLKHLETEPADLVITDIFMEEMEGLETIQTLKKRFPGLLIVAMSGGSRLVGLDCLEMARALGADATLQKPVPFDMLTQTIRGLDSSN